MNFSGPGGINFKVANPLQPLSDVGSSIAGIPTSIGHGLANFLVLEKHAVDDWLGRQAIAFFVAAVVLLVLFSGDEG